MIPIQMIFIVLLVTFYSFLLVHILKKFKLGLRKSYIFILPLIIYASGFYLRLQADKSLIDLGFFFTEFTSMFVSMLFAVFLLLGQLKYWKSDF